MFIESPFYADFSFFYVVFLKPNTIDMSDKTSQIKAFERLLNIMDDLREKCPWDRKQTFETLRHLTIEETYELGDAILENNLDTSSTSMSVNFSYGFFVITRE